MTFLTAAQGEALLGFALAVAGGALLRILRVTKIAPEIVLLLALAAVVRLGVGPGSPSWLELWQHALADTPALRLVLVGLFWALAVLRPPRGNPILLAAAGGLIGGLPAAMIAVPRARSAPEAAGLALLAHATSLTSPFGGGAQAALGTLSPGLWLPAGLICALIAAIPLWRAPKRPPFPMPEKFRPDAGLAGIAGLIVGGIAGPSLGAGAGAVLGLIVAVLLSALSLRWEDPDVERPDPLVGSLPAREALAGIGLVGAAHLYGAVWQGADRVGEIVTFHHAPLLATAVGLVLGCLTDPGTAGLLTTRVGGMADDPQLVPLLALGIAASPLGALIVAARVYGKETLWTGIPLGALQAAAVLVWVEARPWLS